MRPLVNLMIFRRSLDRGLSLNAITLCWLGTHTLTWATPAMAIPVVPQGIELKLERSLPAVAVLSYQAPQPSRPLRIKVAAKPAQKLVPEVLLLAVTLNGIPLKEVVRTEQLPGGPLMLSAEVWSEARLLPLAQAITLSDGTPGFALDAVPGLT